MVVPSIAKVGLYDFGDRYCTFSDNYGDDGGHDLRHRTAINQRAWLTWFCAWFMWLHPQLVQRHSLPLLFTSVPFRSLPLQHLVLRLSVDIVVVVLRLQFVEVAH